MPAVCQHGVPFWPPSPGGILALIIQPLDLGRRRRHHRSPRLPTCPFSCPAQSSPVPRPNCVRSCSRVGARAADSVLCHVAPSHESYDRLVVIPAVVLVVATMSTRRVAVLPPSRRLSVSTSSSGAGRHAENRGPAEHRGVVHASCREHSREPLGVAGPGSAGPWPQRRVEVCPAESLSHALKTPLTAVTIAANNLNASSLRPLNGRSRPRS